MVATARAGLAVLLLGAAFALSGCSLNALEVVIPDFESNQILGVNVYHRVAETGDPDADWERVSKIVFDEPYATDSGVEVMAYTVQGVEAGFDFMTAVERSGESADRVTVEFLYDRSVSAPVRVTTFNAVGESLPSAETLKL